MEPWPFAKLDLAREAGPKGSAVLLTTGAMNPAHRGHAAMLHQARSRLEADGVAVLGAFVSPSHDAYVQPKAVKFGTIGLSSRFRLRAAQWTVADDPLVSVGLWEAQQPGRWPDFPEVCAALQAALDDLAASHGREAVRCFYVCGSDHANKCGLWSSRPSLHWGGVVVVPRDGDALAGSEDVSRCVYLAEPASDTSALSSTKVRQAIERGDFEYIRVAVSAAAVTFLLQPTPEDFECFRSDFVKLGVKAPVPPAQGTPSTYGGTASASAMSSIGRTVFISLSALLRKPWAELSADGRLPSALFFFGSKRAWIFPATDAARQESAANNPQYLKMDQRLRECILRKEEEGLVFWLKPDGFVYDGGLYSGDPGAYTRASKWLQGLQDPATGAPYRPLLLDPSWWRRGAAGGGFDPDSAKYTKHVKNIIKNMENGAHDYDPFCELLVQSNPSLTPAFT